MTFIVTNKLTPINQITSSIIKLTSDSLIFRKNWETDRRENYAIFASVRSAASLFPPSVRNRRFFPRPKPRLRAQGGGLAQAQRVEWWLLTPQLISTCPAPSYPNEKNMLYCAYSSLDLWTYEHFPFDIAYLVCYKDIGHRTLALLMMIWKHLTPWYRKLTGPKLDSSYFMNTTLNF